MGRLPEIAGFQVNAELGSGAMGRVYSAEVTVGFAGLDAGEFVALKVINPELLNDANARARFDRELRIGITVNDKHLMRMYGSGKTSENLPFVAMELLEGRTLDCLLAHSRGPLPVDDAACIAGGMASGLKVLHDKGIVHRDLKPRNVMVLEHGQVKLMDYGLARMMDHPTELTRSGDFVGTFLYSSPEQFGGFAGVPSDLWSLGVIMYEMLTGRLPFDYQTIPEVISAIQIQAPLPPETINPLVSMRLSNIVRRLLEKNIHHRLASADEVLSALEQKPGAALSEFLSEAFTKRDYTQHSFQASLPIALHFLGRKAECGLAVDSLKDPRVPGVVVTGIKGLGKSALLAEICNRLRGDFPAGALYYDVRREKLNWGLMAERIFKELGFDSRGLRIEEALVRVLGEHPILLVIDACEEFSAEDWSEAAQFLSLVEKLRADDGFNSFPAAIMLAARALPVHEHELALTELPLTGLTDQEGARLLMMITREMGPREWHDEKEREWISGRVGGHPEMLRMIANHAKRQDYRILRRGISSVSGKMMQRIEEVISWSVERLGEEGRRLLPCFACFSNLSCEVRELAAAAGIGVDSLEFEEGLEQLQYTAGLVYWDHLTRTYTFHSSIHEWTKHRLDRAQQPPPSITLLGESDLNDAFDRLALHWEGRLKEIPDEPRSEKDLKPLLSAIEYRLRRGEVGEALEHFNGFRFKTELGGEWGESLSRILRRLGLFSRWLTLVQQMAAMTDRKKDPILWANAQFCMSRALFNQPTGRKESNVAKSLSLCEDALREFSPEKAPAEWARSMTFLAHILYSLPGGNRNLNVRKSIECCKKALLVLSRETAPYAWSRSTMILGTAWGKLPTGDKAENIGRMIECYELTLEVLSREAAPSHWATTMTNLGVAWWNLPTGDRGENILKAINCYEQSLEVRTREAAPFYWARTMMNLGTAWATLPSGDRSENLQKAIRCYELALEVRTREAAPFDWARTMVNMGLAWQVLPCGEPESNIAKAVDCFEQALEVSARASDPFEWAMAKLNLGVALEQLSRSDHGQLIDKAIRCLDESLEVFTREDAPLDWARTTNHLAIAWRTRQFGDRGENLNRAVELHRAALDVHTREEFPEAWANDMLELGQTWLACAALNMADSRESLGQAIVSFEAALEVLTEEEYPHDYPRAQAACDRALAWLETGDDPGNQAQ